MRKGFTLVELLAVIIILGIVTGVTVPIVTNAVNNSKTKAYDEQVRLIIDAGRSYMSKHASQLPNNASGRATVSVATLKNDGYLANKNIKNPVYVVGSTDVKKKCQYLNGSVVVTYQNNKYNYSYESTC